MWCQQPILSPVHLLRESKSLCMISHTCSSYLRPWPVHPSVGSATSSQPLSRGLRELTTHVELGECEDHGL